MKQHLVRHLFLLLILIAFAAAVLLSDRAEKRTVELPDNLWPQACAKDEQDVTAFMIETTNLEPGLSLRWKQGCPNRLCGRNTDKFIRLNLVCMKKTGVDTYRVRAIGTAHANFGAFTPLANLQVASAQAIVDYDACRITLTRKLTFKQPAVTAITGFFVVVGDSVSITDSAKNNRCDNYRPPKAG
jgi:hypothetical protein